MKNLVSYSRKNLTLMYGIIKAVTIVLTLFAIIFVNNILSSEFSSAKKYMEYSVIQTASNLNGRVINSVNEMRLLALKMSIELKTFSDDEISDFLLRHLGDYDFYRLIFVSKTGKTFAAQKDKGIISNIGSDNVLNFINISQDETPFIKTAINSEVPTGYTNSIGVLASNKGIILSQIFAKKYIQILNYNTYGGKGKSFVINSNGDYVIAPKNSTHQNFFSENIKYVKITKQEILSGIKSKKNGSFLFLKNNEKYIASYSLIDMTNNYVLTTAPLSVITLQINKMLFGITVIVLIIALLLISLLYFSTNLFKSHEELIFEEGFSDKLTGAGNGNKFLLEAREILKNNKSNYALIALNIAGFRAINELYGRKRSDEILKDVYLIIKKNLSEGSIIARNYASEFSLLYKFDKTDDIKEKFIDKVTIDLENYSNKDIKEKFSDDEAPKTTKIKLKYGIYIPDSVYDVNKMYEKAYLAKEELSNNVLENYKFYDEQIRLKLLNEKTIEAQAPNALKENQFKMFLQPKFNILTNELSGAEALVRWIHPEKGMIPPINFIPIFEKNGFILELDRFMWNKAAEFIGSLKKKGIKPFPISVNVSRINMNNDCFISELVDIINKNDIEAKYLELEVTESACFDNEKRFREILNKLKELNFNISMDDFGTGYSSLNMLRHLPVDIIKLDMGFIKDSITDNNTRIILESITQMINRLNMKTVAEGIETQEQLNFLKQIQCSYGQGYLFSKPVDVETFMANFIKEFKMQ